MWLPISIDTLNRASADVKLFTILATGANNAEHLATPLCSHSKQRMIASQPLQKVLRGAQNRVPMDGYRRMIYSDAESRN